MPSAFASVVSRSPLAAALSLLATAAAAQPPTPQELGTCAAIGAAADRLACYDKLAGRAPVQPASATTQQPPGGVDADPGSPSLLAPATEPVPPAAAPARGRASLLSKVWELDPEDKRGTFLLTGYRTNYLQPLHFTSRINRAPQSPTQAPVQRPAYRKLEAKFQLSLRTKIVQGLLWHDADLWLGYTQHSLWQIYNGADSKPFRNTDYEPELMYVVPTDRRLRQLPFEWQWRYWQLGLAHQSNGQSDPLSRSWNRVYLAGGFERGPWSLIARVNKRIREELPSDNNPDLVSYRGRGEFMLGWASGAHVATLQYRSTLQDAKFGSLSFEYSYPVFGDQPNGMRWLLQVFHGYGETLTDYNFRQTSLGLGVSFLQF